MACDARLQGRVMNPTNICSVVWDTNVQFKHMRQSTCLVLFIKNISNQASKHTRTVIPLRFDIIFATCSYNSIKFDHFSTYVTCGVFLLAIASTYTELEGLASLIDSNIIFDCSLRTVHIEQFFTQRFGLQDL